MDFTLSESAAGLGCFSVGLILLYVVGRCVLPLWEAIFWPPHSRADGSLEERGLRKGRYNDVRCNTHGLYTAGMAVRLHESPKVTPLSLRSRLSGDCSHGGDDDDDRHGADEVGREQIGS